MKNVLYKCSSFVVNLFEKYSSHHNEIVSEFSGEICGSLNK